MSKKTTIEKLAGDKNTAASPLKGRGPRARYNILLAEDEPINRELMATIIEQQNWEVTAVENGRNALSAMENTDFDLVLMDIQMPVMDGREATDAIRKKEEVTGKHIPIIALTAYAIGDFREECLAHGFDDYIPKPFRLEELLHTVEKLLEKSKQRRRLKLIIRLTAERKRLQQLQELTTDPQLTAHTVWLEERFREIGQ